MVDLKMFVKNVVEEVLKSKYPYVLRPAMVLGKIVAKNLLETGYSYTVCILDANGEKDSEYPEIPNVWSDMELAVGDAIAAAFLDKGQKLYIIGRVII